MARTPAPTHPPTPRGEFPFGTQSLSRRIWQMHVKHAAIRSDKFEKYSVEWERGREREWAKEHEVCMEREKKWRNFVRSRRRTVFFLYNKYQCIINCIYIYIYIYCNVFIFLSTKSGELGELHVTICTLRRQNWSLLPPDRGPIDMTLTPPLPSPPRTPVSLTHEPWQQQQQQQSHQPLRQNQQQQNGVQGAATAQGVARAGKQFEFVALLKWIPLLHTIIRSVMYY